MYNLLLIVLLKNVNLHLGECLILLNLKQNISNLANKLNKALLPLWDPSEMKCTFNLAWDGRVGTFTHNKTNSTDTDEAQFRLKWIV